MGYLKLEISYLALWKKETSKNASSVKKSPVKIEIFISHKK